MQRIRDLAPDLPAEQPSRPFLLADTAAEAVTAPARLSEYDPLEHRLSGKLLRAQLRGTLPARIR